MHSFIEDTFISKNWLPNYMKKERSYLTVSVGCTGENIALCIALRKLRRSCLKLETLIRHRKFYDG